MENTNKEFLVYLASPFFNDEQVARVKKVEQIIESIDGVKCFSPMRDGTVCPPDATREIRRKAFDSNIVSIKDCQLVVAIIDDKDTGTTFEMGMAFAQTIPIVAFAETERHKLNLMLAEAFTAYDRGSGDIIKKVIGIIKDCGTDVAVMQDDVKKIRDGYEAKEKSFLSMKDELMQLSSDVHKESSSINDRMTERIQSMVKEITSITNETIFKGEIE